MQFGRVGKHRWNLKDVCQQILQPNTTPHLPNYMQGGEDAVAGSLDLALDGEGVQDEDLEDESIDEVWNVLRPAHW